MKILAKACQRMGAVKVPVFSRNQPNNRAGKKIEKCHQRKITTLWAKAKTSAVTSQAGPTQVPKIFHRLGQIRFKVDWRYPRKKNSSGRATMSSWYKTKEPNFPPPAGSRPA